MRKKVSISPADRARSNERVTDYDILKRFSDRVNWLASTHTGGFHWIAKYTDRSHGWWAYVANQKWDQVVPTRQRITTIDLLYELEKSHLKAQENIKAALIEIMEWRARIDQSLIMVASQLNHRQKH